MTKRSFKVVKYQTNLKDLIKLHGFTEMEVAEETQIPLRSLNAYCNGHRNIPNARRKQIVDFLGCSLQRLYCLPFEGGMKDTDCKGEQDSSPACSQEHINMLVELASTLVKQGDISSACRYLHQALMFTSVARLSVVYPRIEEVVMLLLSPWQNEECVQTVNYHLRSVHACFLLSK